MAFVCLACQQASLEIVASLELPSDARSDEITVQVVACRGCGLRAIAIYEESRRGAGESWTHLVCGNGPGDVERVSALIAACPAPRESACGCPSHRLLGGWDAGGTWKRLGDAGIVLKERGALRYAEG